MTPEKIVNKASDLFCEQKIPFFIVALDNEAERVKMGIGMHKITLIRILKSCIDELEKGIEEKKG